MARHRLVIDPGPISTRGIVLAEASRGSVPATRDAVARWLLRV